MILTLIAFVLTCFVLNAMYELGIKIGKAVQEDPFVGGSLLLKIILCGAFRRALMVFVIIMLCRIAGVLALDGHLPQISSHITDYFMNAVN